MKSTVFVALLLSSQVQGFFRLTCFNPITIERADPIVSPGKVAGHTHIVSGGSSFSPTASGGDLRASNCSSCAVQQDMSAYWTPNLYFQFANGTVQSVNTQDGGGVYYRVISNPNDQTAPTAFPDNFRMIAGSSSNRDPTTIGAGRIRYTCILSTANDLTITSSANLPSTDCPGGLMTVIQAPSCWDGINVDSVDHQSHVSYPLASGACPTAFPVRLASLTHTMTYLISQFLPYRSLALNPSQPFVFSNGDPTGYGFHFDFANGWKDLTVLQAALDQCTATIPELCPPLSMYPTPHSCHRTPDINEAVTGILPRGLPGNNPINWGPAASVPVPATSIPPFVSNPVVYARAPPPDAIVLGNTPRVVLTSGNWTYQSCYAWNNQALPALSHTLTSAVKSVESCLSACTTLNYAYCAVGNSGASCLGGNILSNISTSVGFDRCGTFCTDAPTELCGDYSGVSELYERAIPPPLIVQAHNNWTYSACYTNWVQGAGLLSRTLNVITNKTMPYCLDQCDLNGFDVCGMSGGTTCYGGISIQGPNVVADVSTCDTPCAGDSTRLCGGVTNLLVYQRPASTTVVQQAGNYSYVSCYSASSLSTPLVSPLKTVESCMSVCQQSGFLYCGVQDYGYMCWGSNTLASGSSSVSFGACATACYGAPLEWCGGTGAIGLYQLTPKSSSSAISSSTTRAIVTFSSSSSSTTLLLSSASTTTSASSTVTISSTKSSSISSPASSTSRSSTTTSVKSSTASTTTFKSAGSPTSPAIQSTSKSASSVTTQNASSTTTTSSTTTSKPSPTTTTTSTFVTSSKSLTSSGTCPTVTVTIYAQTLTVSSCPSTSTAATLPWKRF